MLGPILDSIRAAVFGYRASYLDKKIDRLVHEATRSNARLEAHIQTLEALNLNMIELQNEFKHASENAKKEILNAAKINEKMKEALEATREELNTTKKITIPGLVESNQFLIERWKAETAIQSMRSALKPTKDEF